MKAPLAGTLIFFLLISSVSAIELHGLSARYEILGNEVLVTNEMVFNKNITGFEFRLPKDASGIEVFGPSYDLVNLKDEIILKVSGESFDSATIKYVSGYYIERTGDSYFILDLGEFQAEEKSISLILPEMSRLKYPAGSDKNSVFPKSAEITTDGQRIMIEWQKQQLEGVNGILVIYDEMRSNILFLILIPIFIIIAVILIFFLRKKVPEKKENANEMTRNLFEEEKKIVEILLKEQGNEIWQKQLLLKSGIPKVRLSRKLRSLEQKGVIESIPYGNSNKIRLKQN